MFDISFAELLVFVTGAGLLLGRKELLVGAKYTGLVVGRVIGTLHGLKANYEATSQQTELKTLHNSVRTGLRGE
jgi:Sec-independent protein translocase protein TatA